MLFKTQQVKFIIKLACDSVIYERRLLKIISVCWVIPSLNNKEGKMVSSRWDKQNTARFNIAFWTLLISIMIIGFPAWLFELKGWPALVASIIGLAAGFVLAFTLLKHQANSMIRVLKFSYKAIERDFRILFKDNNIHFNRKTEEDAYHYHFPGFRNLGMTIQRYDLLNLGVKNQNEMVLSATKITLADLDPENKVFAENLAGLIDEMASNLSKQSKNV
jgi:hypothetical protein